MYPVKHDVRVGRREPKAHRTAPHHSEEAEEAVLIEPLEADVKHHEREERVLCFGRTKSGRLLTVLYTERNDKIRVVTGVWDDRGAATTLF